MKAMRKSSVLFFIMTILLVCVIKLSYGAITGKIAGEVTDIKTKNTLVGAYVMIVGTSMGAPTSQAGTFLISNIPPGVYTLGVMMKGYETVQVESVNVASDFTSNVDVALTATVRPGSKIAQISFEEIGSTANVDDANDGRGVAWIDINKNDTLDLFLANSGSAPDKLFLNKGKDKKGNFVFDEIAQNANVQNDHKSDRGIAHADIDNNKLNDFYVTSGIVEHLLYHNDSNKKFTNIANSAGVNSQKGTSISWTNLNGDSYPDFYVAIQGGPNFLYINNTDETFSDTASSAGVDDSSWSNAAAWGYFNKDNLPDLYVGNTGPNRLFKNVSHLNDDSTEFIIKFEDITSKAGVGDPGNTIGVAWGDYNNDGYPDLFVSNLESPNKLYHNNGNETFTDSAVYKGMAYSGKSYGCAWSDIDNDSLLDLYVAVGKEKENDSKNLCYINKGNGKFQEMAHELKIDDDGDGRCITWGDFDNDGDLDLYLSNNNGKNRLFQNNAANIENANNWLIVEAGGNSSNLDGMRTWKNLIGDWQKTGNSSNLDGIGTRLTVVTGKSSQIREVDGGSGYLSQNSLPVEFGLGKADKADSLIVQWPSGIEQIFLNTSANQFIPIPEYPIFGPVTTFRVNMKVQIRNDNFNPAIDTLVVRGSFNDWAGNQDKLTDDDGDRIYTAIVNMPHQMINDTIYYKYVIVPDVGEDKPEIIENREYTLLNGGQILDVVYFDNQVKRPANVTFRTNMFDMLDKGWFNPSTDSIRVVGSLNDWSNTESMKPDIIDSLLYIYETTITAVPGEEILWKFACFPSDHFQNNGWEAGDNHVFTFTGDDIVLDPLKPNILPVCSKLQTGVIVGLNFSDLSGLDERDISDRTVFGIGGVLDLGLGKNFYLHTGAMYIQKGGLVKKFNRTPEFEFDPSYLEIPIFLKLAFGNKLRPYVMAGPIIGYLLSSELEGEATYVDDLGNLRLFTFKNDIKEVTESFDFSIGFGSGVSYPISLCSTVFLEVRYTIGILDIIKEGTIELRAGPEPINVIFQEDDELKTKGFQIMLGVTFPFGK